MKIGRMKAYFASGRKRNFPHFLHFSSDLKFSTGHVHTDLFCDMHFTQIGTLKAMVCVHA